MLKLRDLDAQLIGNARDGAFTRFDTAILTDGVQGVLFQCPKCAAGMDVVEHEGRRGFAGAHYIAIWFANPCNTPVAPQDADAPPHHRWIVSGTSLDDLTLSPSVNLDVVGGGDGSIHMDICRWHGWVTNGGAG
jgi:hypothetical protein